LIEDAANFISGVTNARKMADGSQADLILNFRG